MDDRIRKKLIECARQKAPISYSELNDQLELGFDFSLGHHRDEIGQILGEISEHEFDKGRPLLSALVIHKGPDKEQGDGFYKLCEYLYDIPWQELKADRNFELDKMKDCYKFWLDPNNYEKYKNDY